MSLLLNSIVVSVILLFIVFSTFFLKISRSIFIKKELSGVLTSIFHKKIYYLFIYSLIVILLVVNLLGNVPLNSIPTLFYSQTLTISLMFWLPLMLVVSFSQMKGFLAHILPYGRPVSLMLLLPLVEIFSQFIRPFTLMIRLRTNLSRGHIIVYMFSYFTLSSAVLTPVLDVVISILFVLELFISLLQAYIFRSLLILYFEETV